MAFTVIEWFVLVFSLLVLIKVLFLLFSPKSWLKFAKNLYKSPSLLVVVEVILAAVLLYYLLQSMTIIQIMSAIVLGALLTAISFAVYAKELMSWTNKVMKKSMLKRAWVPILIWLVLALWALYVLLF